MAASGRFSSFAKGFFEAFSDVPHVPFKVGGRSLRSPDLIPLKAITS